MAAGSDFILDALLQEEDGVRPAIDLVYRAIVRAATEVPESAEAPRPAHPDA